MARTRRTKNNSSGPGKTFWIIVIVLVCIAFYYGYPKLRDTFLPQVVEAPAIPVAGIIEGPTNSVTTGVVPGTATDILSGAPSGPLQFRVHGIPWIAQSGLFYANGGAVTVPGSLMDKYRVNVSYTRQDMYGQMQNDLVAFAQECAAGRCNTDKGIHFAVIMGNGAPGFLAELNEQLISKLGYEYRAEIFAPIGYSRGEDKCMATPEALSNKLIGSVIGGVKLDGDEDICFAWMAANKIPNNPDSTVYDPDKVNWYHTDSFVEADNAYNNHYCEKRPEVKNGARTGKMVDACVDGVGTWSPGDHAVTVGTKGTPARGNLVTVASTKDYRWLMPTTMIGIHKFNEDNRVSVENMLAAILEGGKRINEDNQKLMSAMSVATEVFGEGDATYWKNIYTGYIDQDVQGKDIHLGGSYSNNLGDAITSFGLKPGSVDYVSTVYTGRGAVAQSQYPELIRNLRPAKEVINKSFVQALMKRAADAHVVVDADIPQFTSTGEITEVIGKKAWELYFATGKANFTKQSKKVLAALVTEVSTTGLQIEVHGYTDNTGGTNLNLNLSRARGQAVKNWLSATYPDSFPVERIKVVPHGEADPIATNSTVAGRAQNRRVEIVIGK